MHDVQRAEACFRHRCNASQNIFQLQIIQQLLTRQRYSKTDTQRQILKDTNTKTYGNKDKYKMLTSTHAHKSIRQAYWEVWSPGRMPFPQV